VNAGPGGAAPPAHREVPFVRMPLADGVHTLRIPLRYGDLDTLGHVNQAVYHQLMELGRVRLIQELLAAAADGEPDDAGPRGWVLARVELDHRHELLLDDGDAIVEHRLARLGSSSVTLDCRIVTPAGVLVAEARTVMVAWDGEARGSRAITELERRGFELLATT
jgi:acyl-CoA thioester hydrolase